MKPRKVQMRRDPSARDLSWQDRANRLGLSPDLFFPAKHENGKVTEARKVCAGCACRRECLEYALAEDMRFGVWGGTSERQRERIRAERKRGAA